MTNVAQERRQIPIGAATFKEMRDFAQTDMGIEIKNGWQKAHIITALKDAGWEHNYIAGPAGEAPPPVAEVEVEPEVPAAPPEPRDPNAPPEAKEPLFTIMIQEQEGAGGKRPVFVAVNGTGILLPRNQEMAVKRRYVEALKSAIQTNYELDEQTNQQVQKNMFSYPFQVLEPPPKAEIAAWLAWEKYESDLTTRREREHDERIREESRRRRRA